MTDELLAFCPLGSRRFLFGRFLLLDREPQGDRRGFVEENSRGDFEALAQAGDMTAVELPFAQQDERGRRLKAEFGGNFAFRDAVPFHQQAQNLKGAGFWKWVAGGFVLHDEQAQEIDGLLLGGGPLLSKSG